MNFALSDLKMCSEIVFSELYQTLKIRIQVHWYIVRNGITQTTVMAQCKYSLKPNKNNICIKY
jgi:hypothetical protein